MSPVHQVRLKPSCKATVKGGRRQGSQRKRWKDTSGNGQAWSSPSPRRQWRTEKWRKLVAKSSVVPQRPLRLRDRWDEIWDLRDKTTGDGATAWVIALGSKLWTVLALYVLIFIIVQSVFSKAYINCVTTERSNFCIDNYLKNELSDFIW